MEVRLCFVRRTESGLHLFYGLRKLLRMADEVQEKDPYIEGRARNSRNAEGSGGPPKLPAGGMCSGR